MGTPLCCNQNINYMTNVSLEPVELTFQEVKLTCPIEEGHRMIPVRTVCDIIDVNFQSQDNWLKEHAFFAQLYRLSTTTGADGKSYEMRCLSIFDIDGWLHSITEKNRKPGSVEKQYAFLAWLREQKMQLYKSIEVFMHENRYELDLITQKEQALEELELAQENVKLVKDRLKKINTSIEDVRAKRYTGQTALPFPKESYN